MDHKSIKLSCRYCKEEKTMQSIVQHAVKSKCPYTKEQILSLRKQSKIVSDAKKKIKMAEMYQRKKAKIKEAYQQEKIDHPEKFERKKMERAKKNQALKNEHPDEYEKKREDRAKKYQAERFELASQYQKRKHETVKNGKACKVKDYDKAQRKIKHKEELPRIKQKREDKESGAGKYFKKEVFDPILFEVHD